MTPAKLPPEFFKLVSKVTVVRLIGGADYIMFEIPSLLSPYPELDIAEPGGYPTSFKLEVRRGYATEWLLSSGYTGPYTVVG